MKPRQGLTFSFSQTQEKMEGKERREGRENRREEEKERRKRRNNDRREREAGSPFQVSEDEVFVRVQVDQ